jgi:hypothetical protein
MASIFRAEEEDKQETSHMLLGRIFEPKGRKDILLRNFGELLPNHMALQPEVIGVKTLSLGFNLNMADNMDEKFLLCVLTTENMTIETIKFLRLYLKNPWAQSGIFLFIASGVGLRSLYCDHFWPILPAPDDR